MTAQRPSQKKKVLVKELASTLEQLKIKEKLAQPTKPTYNIRNFASNEGEGQFIQEEIPQGSRTGLYSVQISKLTKPNPKLKPSRSPAALLPATPKPVLKGGIVYGNRKPVQTSPKASPRDLKSGLANPLTRPKSIRLGAEPISLEQALQAVDHPVNLSTPMLESQSSADTFYSMTPNNIETQKESFDDSMAYDVESYAHSPSVVPFR